MTAGVVMAISILMVFAMVALVVWYITKGYAYRHTVDELPSNQPEQKPGSDSERQPE